MIVLVSMKKKFNSFAALGKDMGIPETKKKLNKKFHLPKKNKSLPVSDSEWVVETYKLLQKFSGTTSQYGAILKAASNISIKTILRFKPSEKIVIERIILLVLSDLKKFDQIEVYKIDGMKKLLTLKQKNLYHSELNKILKNNTNQSKINWFLDEDIRKKEFLKFAKEQNRLESLLLEKQQIADDQRKNELLELANYVSKKQTETFGLFQPFELPYYQTPSVNLNLNLDQDDIKLIFNWAGFTIDSSHIEISDIYEELNDTFYDGTINKLISARYAEKSAILFYKDLDERVQDISIKQLDPQNNEWKLGDIKAGKKFIDIKNARTSRKSGSNYSDQYVKSLKTSVDGQEIVYTGVISEYQTKTKICNESNGESRILGEVTNTDIQAMNKYLKDRFTNILEMKLTRSQSNISNYNGRKGLFIPGWMFEYPDSFYEKKIRDSEKITGVKSLINLFQTKELIKKMDPFFYFIQSRFKELDTEQIPLDYSSIIQELHQINLSIGLSRRSIFIFILAYSLESLKVNKDFNPVIFNKIFFDNKAYPLGFLDSENYISNLIKMLQKIWKTNKDSLHEYNAFKLSGFNILRGFKNNRWETIYAYCGGYLPNKAKCQKTPIYLGQCEICNSCGMLICTDCYTCSTDCQSK